MFGRSSALGTLKYEAYTLHDNKDGTRVEESDGTRIEEYDTSKNNIFETVF